MINFAFKYDSYKHKLSVTKMRLQSVLSLVRCTNNLWIKA